MDHTTLQGEAMASQRQLERLWKQVRRLHQRDEYWATTSRLARMWITPKHAPPYRPYVTIVLSQQGKIVSSHVLEHPPTAEALFAELLRAMRRPAGWRRPAPHPDLSRQRRRCRGPYPLLEALNIQCVYRPVLSMADEVMGEMETYVGKYQPLPGLVSIPSVTPQLLGHLYHLAAQFYQASPWGWFHDHHPFAIQCPPEETPRYAIVMGSGGKSSASPCMIGLRTCKRCSRHLCPHGRWPSCAPGASSSLKRHRR